MTFIFPEDETGSERFSNLLKITGVVSRLNWDLNPGSLGPETMFLTINPNYVSKLFYTDFLPSPGRLRELRTQCISFPLLL